MALIKIENVSKIYTTGRNILTPALQEISLEIHSREFTAIAGPSGSGKSSLLHLIGALDAPSSGKIFYEQADLTSMPPDELSNFRRDHIGFVFQAYNLINTLTALENVEYIMLLQGISYNKRREKAEELLKRMGLNDYLNRFPNEMSGGQQQRVAIARALAAEPKIILADEPTANLDSKTADSLLNLMMELNQEQGVTFLFSTHDASILNKAKRIINLKDGKIV